MAGFFRRDSRKEEEDALVRRGASKEKKKSVSFHLFPNALSGETATRKQHPTPAWNPNQSVLTWLQVTCDSSSIRVRLLLH